MLRDLARTVPCWPWYTPFGTGEGDDKIKLFNTISAAVRKGINPWGAISGLSIDGVGVAHGFVRAPNGTITVFDAPGAGNGGGQGTAPQSINEVGEVTGGYVDTNFVAHGFIRKP